jgi:hypothetical protein
VDDPTRSALPLTERTPLSISSCTYFDDEKTMTALGSVPNLPMASWHADAPAKNESSPYPTPTDEINDMYIF